MKTPADEMHPSYFAVKFRCHGDAATLDWPNFFAIVSAYATTGQIWTEAENQAADQALAETLRTSGRWHRRITGWLGDHEEPGFAVSMDFEAACDLGLRFRQDAIYLVQGDRLAVSFCDTRRALVEAGTFRSRLKISG